MGERNQEYEYPGGRRTVFTFFALITLGSALGNLSQTGLNAMLPSVMGSFGIDVDVGQWLTTAYMLVLGIAVPIATFLTRRLSDRQYLQLGLGLFALGSLVDMVAPGFASMLAGRVLQAVSVGLLMPLMQTIAMTRFPPGRQATAMGVAGIAMGFAPNIGPTIGGAMEFAFGWRSFFALLAGLAVLLFLLACAVVKPGEALDKEARFEGLSFVLSALGFGGVLLGLSQASSYGLKSPWFWAPIAVGVLFLVLFFRRQAQVEQPLIRLAVFESRAFRSGLTALVLLFASFMGATLAIPLCVQDLLGGTSLDAGLVVLPAVFTALLINPIAGWLADRFDSRRVAIVFGAALATGAIGCATVGEQTPLWLLAVWQTVRATGVSGLMGPLQSFTLSQLEGRIVASGSSASVLIRQVAGSFGTAIMVFAITAARPLAEAMPALPYQLSFAFSALMAVLCLGEIVFRVR